MNVKEIISQGESQKVEFKSSLQWDTKQQKQNKALRQSVLKTIAAFLNTDGGTLLIGVDDSGQVLGLEKDLALLGNSRDRFEQLMASLLSDSLGAQYAPLIQGRFVEVDGKLIYVVEVKPSSEPVYLKGEREDEFYVRVGTTTRSLTPRETVEYIKNHWPNLKVPGGGVAARQGESAAASRPFHTIATPHKDILEGRLTMDVFAADLWEVFQGRAPDEYQDAARFFEKTFVTEGLRNLLTIVEKRLRGQGGDPIIQVQTPFGGGKTHALIAMYHKAREWNARTVVAVGTAMGPQETLWGLMAEQLTGSRSGFEGLTAPGREAIRALLAEQQPLLILMDEVLEYATKAAGVSVGQSTLAAQTLAFLQELTETVATLEQVCLVITLPASILEHYDENAERLFRQMQKVSGRMEKIYTPVQDYEISHVIRRRLFARVDENAAREVVETFLRFAEQENLLPAGTELSEYRERFLASYPFLPEVIDILYHRWGSFTTFQRTRGALRLLSLVIYTLRERQLPYITLADFDLSDAEIRRELLKHIGPEYDSVIAADITDTTAGARKVDREVGDAYRWLRLGTRVATTIFMHSFSGGVERGATLNEIKRHATPLNTPASIVAEVLERLKARLFYLQYTDGKVYFSNQPNLNRILLVREENIRPEDIHAIEREWLRKRVRGTRLKVYLWPESDNDIPDNAELKLLIMREDDEALMHRFLEQKGATPRVHRNVLFFLVPMEHEHQALQRLLQTYAALRSIEQDTSLNLTPAQRKEVSERIKQLERDLGEQVRRAYRWIYIPDTGGGLRKLDMGVPTFGMDLPLDEEVYDKLRTDGEILEKLQPLVLKERFLRERKYLHTRQLVESWSRTPGALRVVSEEAWRQSIAEGVRQGLFGLGVLEGESVRCTAFKEMPAVALEGSEVILDRQICEAQRAQEEEEETEGGLSGALPGEDENKSMINEPLEGQTTLPPAEMKSDEEAQPQSGRTKLVLRFEVPRGQVSGLLGVLNLLQYRFNRLEITLRVSEGKISEEDYETKIKEAFRQMGVEVQELDE